MYRYLVLAAALFWAGTSVNVAQAQHGQGHGHGHGHGHGEGHGIGHIAHHLHHLGHGYGGYGHYYPGYYSYYRPSYGYYGPGYGYYDYGYYGPGYTYGYPSYYSGASYANYNSPSVARQGQLPANRARVQVILPDPTAQISFDGTKMNSSGTTRTFDPPPLEPGYRYSYKITATWEAVDGNPISIARVVEVIPGQVSVVDFRQPAAEQAPAPAKR